MVVVVVRAGIGVDLMTEHYSQVEAMNKTIGIKAKSHIILEKRRVDRLITSANCLTFTCVNIV